MKLKIGVLSLGCPRNLVDTESILGRLFRKGYQITELGQADAALINTCAFIEDAKRESVEAILDLISLKKEGRLKKIIVYGCLSQRYRSLLSREFPEVDAFVGRVSLDKGDESLALTPGHYAYLKICEGCVNRCSFCVIPKIKGRFTSLPVDAILKKVRHFEKSGISELNIIGQDITGFGRDLAVKISLAKLLKKIIRQAAGIRWIRLLYLHPARLDEELLEIIRGEPKVCKYIDIPVQHINSRVLKAMGRSTSRPAILKAIARARKIIPGVALRTSVIVGFPGETEREFRELLEFIRDTRFERLGAFIYSREEGTKAYSFPGQIPAAVKTDRFNRVMRLQQEVSAEVNRKFIGRDLEILVDERRNGDYLGRSEFDAPEVDGLVYIKSRRRLNLGDFVKLKITDTLEYDLVGQES